MYTISLKYGLLHTACGDLNGRISLKESQYDIVRQLKIDE